MAGSYDIVFRPVSAGSHLGLLQAWMQQPHVAAWWDLAGPSERTRDYLYARLRLAHRDCWIVSDRGTRVAYVETFVVSEDPLGDRYEVQPGDRGFDILVGEPGLLGTGVAQRIVRHLVAVLLEQWGITRVVCSCDPGNLRHVAFCRALGAEPVPADGVLLLGWTSVEQLRE
jgi:RimJ/RimL family protein N-acetyltransferase